MYVLIYAITVDIAHVFPSACGGGSRLPRSIKWHAYQHNGIVLDVDGNVLGNSRRGGFGGCFRSSDGMWISGFYGYFNTPLSSIWSF